MKSKIIASIVILVVILGGLQLRNKKSSQEYRETAVEGGSIRKTVNVDGKMSPKVYANIGTELPILIEEIYVSENDYVKKGQELVRLNKNSLQAQVENVRLELERAELAEKFARRTWDNHKPEEKERIKKATEQARQQLKEVLAQAEKVSIVSPINGVVVKQSAQAGEVATGILIKIINLESLQLEIFIPEVDLSKIEKGNKAEIIFDAYLDKIIYGVVSSVDLGSTVNQGSTYYKAIVEINNKDSLLILDGMNADINVITGNKENVTIVPREFTKKDNDGYFVYIKNSQSKNKEILVKKYFETGIIGDKNIEVTSGLSVGEKIFLAIEEE